jgi:hypothetical protein
MLVWAAAVGGGCGPSRPARIPITGLVTFDGEPLAGASVTLVPVAGGRPATGATDAAGRFSLTTFGGQDGVIPGGYDAAVTKLELKKKAAARARELDRKRRQRGNMNQGLTDGNDGGSDDGSDADFVPEFDESDYRSVIPEKYSDHRTSGLHVELRSARDTIEFVLESGP